MKGIIDTEKHCGGRPQVLAYGSALAFSLNGHRCVTDEHGFTMKAKKGPQKLPSAALHRPGNTTRPSTVNFAVASCPGNVN